MRRQFQTRPEVMGRAGQGVSASANHAAAVAATGDAALDTPPRGLRRMLYPESWPAGLRAAVILGVAIIAVYSGSWAAPIVVRPSAGWLPARLMFSLGQGLGAEDTRLYHAFAWALHLASAVFLFGILQWILGRGDRRDTFNPACLGALAWAVHPVMTESLMASDSGGTLIGGLAGFAALYGFMRLAGSGRSAKILAGCVGALGLATWLAFTFRPGDVTGLTGRSIIGGLKLAFWPSPLVFDYGAPLAGFREANLYLPVAGVALLVAFAAAKIGTLRALFVLAVPITALGVMARIRTADYRSALVLWRDTAAKAPANPHAQAELGHALLAAGLGREALAHFERAGELAPTTSARSNLALALLQLGRPADAMRQYEQVVQEEPGNASAHLELAAALTVLGRATEADAHFQTARALGISEADWHRRRGRAQAEAGEFDRAEAELEAALRADPKSVETHIVLGMVLSAMGRPADGMKHFVAAVELNPRDAGAQAALGDALLEDLRPSEALPHFETALRLDPGRAALIHAGLGRALVRLGRAKEAIAHLAAALELNPENAEARADLELIKTAVQRHADKK